MERLIGLVNILIFISLYFYNKKQKSKKCGYIFFITILYFLFVLSDLLIHFHIYVYTFTNFTFYAIIVLLEIFFDLLKTGKKSVYMYYNLSLKEKREIKIKIISIICISWFANLTLVLLSFDIKDYQIFIALMLILIASLSRIVIVYLCVSLNKLRNIYEGNKVFSENNDFNKIIIFRNNKKSYALINEILMLLSLMFCIIPFDNVYFPLYSIALFHIDLYFLFNTKNIIYFF